MLRRRPYLTIFFALLFLLVLAGGIFLFTFDLNRYREEVQTELTAVIGRPITLGKARLSLARGLALNFSAISIPATKEDIWSLEAGSLLTRMKVPALLRGRVEFSEIVLVHPRLRVLLRRDLPPTPAEMPEWGRFGIRALTIRDGSITVEDRRDPASPLNLQVERVHLRLLDFASGRRAWLTIAGMVRQEGAPAALDIAGEIVPAAVLRQSTLNLALKLDRLDAALLAPYLPSFGAISGSLSLALNLSKPAAAGLKVSGAIDGQQLTAAFPRWYKEPLAFTNVHLAGTWSREENLNRLSDATLTADALQASGSLAWRWDNDALWVDASVSTPNQPVEALTRILPQYGPAAAIKAGLAGGTWQIDNLHYAGPVKDLVTAAGLPQGKVQVRDLRWRGGGERLGAMSFAALFADDLLRLDGTAEFLQTPLRISGTVRHPFTPERQIAAKLEGIFAADRLLTEVPAAKEKVTAAGQIPFTGTIEGDRQKVAFTIDSRIAEASLAFGASPGQPLPLTGSLSLAGTVTADQVEVGQARLQLPAVDLRGNGRYERTGRKRFSMALEFAGLDLRKLRPHLAVLEKFEASGFLDGQCDLAGADGRLSRRTGTVRLRDAGLRPTAVIAPLSQINGRLRLNEQTVEIEQATAHLGNSPINVTGFLRDGDGFTADLQVRGKSVRADELIFASDQLLRDVDGHLRIDRRGIRFTPATVRLDGGTVASVRGDVTFAPPTVDLDIEAAQGNIDEVIALWRKPAAAQAEPAPRSGREQNGGNGVRVRIGARVGEGSLGDLRFQKAEGEIFYHHNFLEIFPLRFQVGPGTCLGRVAVEFGGGAPLLVTSGHLENVDAAAIYQQLLKRRGLVTGALRGDFYVEGRLGSEFLRTSSGGFNFETRDGVLRKFAILGKIFSVLNVSQILTLQLPDMAKDGMPFQRLTGNFALRQGILSTEDLFVESPAMNLSVVGEMDLPAEKIDLVMGIKPLRTVDKIVTRIPVAGWLLAGEEKALITIHFRIHGHPDHAEVDAVPITSLSEKVFGIFRRVLNLPGKMIDDVGGLVREK